MGFFEETDKSLATRHRAAKRTLKRRAYQKDIAKAKPFVGIKKKKQSKTLSRKTRIGLI